MSYYKEHQTALDIIITFSIYNNNIFQRFIGIALEANYIIFDCVNVLEY